MRKILQLLSTRDISYGCSRSYSGISQLRLSNVLLKKNQLFHADAFCKHRRGPSMLGAASLEFGKLSCKYFSVKVDTKDERAPISEPSKAIRPPEVISKGISVKEPVTTNDYNHNNGRVSGFPVNTAVLINELRSMATFSLRDNAKIHLICNQLCSLESEIPVKDCIQILYYLSYLKIPHENLLSKISKNIVQSINDIYKPLPFITTISRSLSKLLLRDVELLDAIISWYITRLEVIELSSAMEVIQSLALLNYFPLKADVLLKEVIHTKPMDYSSIVQYLNLVWSLVLLDRAEPEMVQLVLLRDYKVKLESVLTPEMRLPVYLKLNNIYAYAVSRNLPIKVDSGLYKSDTPWLYQMKVKRQKNHIVRNVIDSVVSLLPPRTFKMFTEYESGCIIDVICYMDELQQPQTEFQYMKKQIGTRLVLQVLTFKDLCMPSKTAPTGISLFHKNHLEASGFKVLFLPYNDFPAADNLKAKSEYIANKIRTVLPNFASPES